MLRFRDGFWTIEQRTILLASLTVLLVLLSFRRVSHPAPVSGGGGRAGEVPTGVDPNVAPWEELSVLPGIGEKKAKAIVEYRERYRGEHPGEFPFRGPEDLMNIQGIGPSTAKGLAPYLFFPVGEEEDRRKKRGEGISELK